MILLINSDIQLRQQDGAISTRFAVQVETAGIVHGVERLAVKPSRILSGVSALHPMVIIQERIDKYRWWSLASQHPTHGIVEVPRLKSKPVNLSDGSVRVLLLRVVFRHREDT
jgi:hypothetical protein